MTDLTGQCHCGGVQFHYSGEVVGVIVCHCRDCQQLHGASNAMAALDRDGLHLTEATSLIWYTSSNTAKRGFCGSCGGRLFKDNHGSPKIMVSMGAIDPPSGLQVIKNLWTETKGDWVRLPDD